MNFRSLLLTTALSVGGLNLSAQWTDIGSAAITSSTGAYTQIAKDNSGNFYISYSMGLSGGAVHKFDGTTWSQLGTGATPGSASYGCIGVNASGEVFYGFQDGANSNNLSVRKYDPGTSAWSSTGVAISGSGVNYQTLKINPVSNLPIVSYNQGGIRVKRYDGTDWLDIGAQPIVSGTGINHTTAIGNNDTIYAALQIGTAYSVYKSPVNAPSGTAWELVGTAGFVSGGNGNQFTVSLAVDNNNHLYLAYRALSANGSKIGVQKFDGNSWADLGQQYFSAGNVEHISIALSAANIPYVIYRDNSAGKAVVQYYDGSNWVSLDNASTNIGNYNSIIINNNGVPVVGFADGTGVNGGTPTVKVYSGAPLPIKLGGISAASKGPVNAITWNTLEEARGDVFDVERSKDGIRFAPIGTQKANGRATVYTFEDTDPFEGKNYYRLKLRNLDARILYSKVVSAVQTREKKSLNCYPNPAKQLLHIEIPPANENMTLSIFDLSGHKVYSKEVRGSKSAETLSIDVRSFPVGTYLLKLAGNSLDMQQMVVRQ
jgi:hypothetical protein